MENNLIVPEQNKNTNTAEPNDMNINKQIFIDRPFGKITIGKLIVMCSFVNIACLSILFFFTGLVCLHTFRNRGFWQPFDPYSSNSRLSQAGIAIVVLDCIFLISALILQIFIYKYKMDLKKKLWKRMFWTLIIITFLFVLFGLSDSTRAPWIYVWERGISGRFVKSGGWWLILGIFIGILIYFLILTLSEFLPYRIKRKLFKILPKNTRVEEKTTNE